MGLTIHCISLVDSEQIPMLQTIGYSAIQWGKILSSVIFALTMKSPNSQLAFFICIGLMSTLSSVLYCCNINITFSYIGRTKEART